MSPENRKQADDMIGWSNHGVTFNQNIRPYSSIGDHMRLGSCKSALQHASSKLDDALGGFSSIRIRTNSDYLVCYTLTGPLTSFGVHFLTSTNPERELAKLFYAFRLLFKQHANELSSLPMRRINLAPVLLWFSTNILSARFYLFSWVF